MKLAPIYNAVGAIRSGRLGQPPVFIVGTGRCGTTLLFHVLKTHPELAVFPTEANDLWHPNAYPYARRTIDTPSMEQDPAEFSRRSRQSWPSDQGKRIKRIFSGFQFTHGPTRRFVAQSAMTCYLLPSILDLWPDALIIHLIRDGRPTVLSLTKKNFRKANTDAASQQEYRIKAAKYWSDSVLAVAQFIAQSKLPANRFLQLRYERLCEAPAEELQKLCQFTGIASERFGYDLSRIQSRNFKADGVVAEAGWSAVEEVLAPAMAHYGYESIAEQTP